MISIIFVESRRFYFVNMVFKILQIAIPFIWVGMVAAISFMEAPLKFLAPGITTALGVGIGRIVFQALNKVEITFAVLLLLSVLFKPFRQSLQFYLLGAVIFILLLQTFWLLPALDSRALKLMAGEQIESSSLHTVYILLEITKFLLLLYLGILSTKVQGDI